MSLDDQMKNATTIAVVDAQLFRIASQAQAADSESRYYLRGTLIEPHPLGGVVMVSTDGHCLVAVHDKGGRCDGPVIVQLPRKALKKCRNRSSQLPRTLEIDLAARSAALIERVRPDAETSLTPIGTILIHPQAIIDATFPDWMKLMPRPVEPALKNAVNPVHLKALAKIGKLMRSALKARGEGVRFWHTDREMAPIVVRWPGVDIAFAVVMPMRWQGADDEPALPAFFHSALPPKTWGPEPEALTQ